MAIAATKESARKITKYKTVSKKDNKIDFPVQARTAKNHEYTNLDKTVRSDYDLDISSATIHTVKMSNDNLQVNFVNPPDAGNSITFSIFVKQSPDGNKTVSWPKNVVWSDSLIPKITKTANKTDVFTFITFDGGNIYYGSQVMANIAV